MARKPRLEVKGGLYLPDHAAPQAQTKALVRAVENVCDVPRKDFCSPAKGARIVFAKEALILSGARCGSLSALQAGRDVPPPSIRPEVSAA